jgi:hypothetical protein
MTRAWTSEVNRVSFRFVTKPAIEAFDKGILPGLALWLFENGHAASPTVMTWQVAPSHSPFFHTLKVVILSCFLMLFGHHLRRV